MRERAAEYVKEGRKAPAPLRLWWDGLDGFPTETAEILSESCRMPMMYGGTHISIRQSHVKLLHSLDLAVVMVNWSILHSLGPGSSKGVA